MAKPGRGKIEWKLYNSKTALDLNIPHSESESETETLEAQSQPDCGRESRVLLPKSEDTETMSNI